MRKASALLLGLSLAILTLSGCKKGSEDTAYDQVGDLRVFDEPRREVTLRNGSTLWNENVPAPMPMKLTTRQSTVKRSYTTVGDIELE